MMQTFQCKEAVTHLGIPRHLGTVMQSHQYKQGVAPTSWGWIYPYQSSSLMPLPAMHQQTKLGCISSQAYPWAVPNGPDM